MAEGKAFWLGVGAGVAAALALTCAARCACSWRESAGMSVIFTSSARQHACMHHMHW